MEEAQIKRLICVTGFGAGNSRGHGGLLYRAAFHLLLGRVYDDKDVQERMVRRTKLDWVIVRPVILTNGPKTNSYRAVIDPRDLMRPFPSDPMRMLPISTRVNKPVDPSILEPVELVTDTDANLQLAIQE